MCAIADLQSGSRLDVGRVEFEATRFGAKRRCAAAPPPRHLECDGDEDDSEEPADRAGVEKAGDVATDYPAERRRDEQRQPDPAVDEAAPQIRRRRGRRSRDYAEE